MDIELIGKYPFLSESKKVLADFSDSALDPIFLEKALSRVDADLNSRAFESHGKEGLITYALARALVSATQNNYIISRFAMAEARGFTELLSKEEKQNILEIAKDLNIEAYPSNDEWVVDVFSYVQNMPKSQEYKLVNQKLYKGKVFLTRHKFIRFLEEAIRARVYSGLPIKKEDIPQVILQLSKRITVKEPNPVKLEKLASSKTPPCMQNLMDRLKRSENLSHQERWILVVYLSKKGVPKEAVKELFKTSPDYNEKITNYQVDFLYSKDYKMPSCSTLKTYGICIAKCGVKSPLDFGRANFESGENPSGGQGSKNSSSAQQKKDKRQQ